MTSSKLRTKRNQSSLSVSGDEFESRVCVLQLLQQQLLQDLRPGLRSLPAAAVRLAAAVYSELTLTLCAIVEARGWLTVA